MIYIYAYIYIYMECVGGKVVRLPWPWLGRQVFYSLLRMVFHWEVSRVVLPTHMCFQFAITWDDGSQCLVYVRGRQVIFVQPQRENRKTESTFFVPVNPVRRGRNR